MARKARKGIGKDGKVRKEITASKADGEERTARKGKLGQQGWRAKYSYISKVGTDLQCFKQNLFEFSEMWTYYYILRNYSSKSNYVTNRLSFEVYTVMLAFLKLKR